MYLAIHGREMKLLSFLASLEVNKKIGDQALKETGGAEEVG